MNIFLLRHGETDWNRAGRLQGHTDIPLNQNGRLQVKRAAKKLAGQYPDIDLIITSPLQRARVSAEIAAKQLAYEKADILVEPLLTERCFGQGEGLTATERSEKYPDDVYPGMESIEELIKRAGMAFQKITTDFCGRENILLVAHGAILYAVLTAITNGKIVYAGKDFKFEPGSIHLIQYSDEAVIVERCPI